MNDYFEKLEDLKKKLGQKMEKIKEAKISTKKQNAKIFKLKWAYYKSVSPMVKKLLIPLVKALKKVYPVKFETYIDSNKDRGSLEIHWRIDIGITYFRVILPNEQKFFDIRRGKQIESRKYIEKFEGKAELEEESLKATLELVFLDYIMQKMA